MFKHQGLQMFGLKYYKYIGGSETQLQAGENVNKITEKGLGIIIRPSRSNRHTTPINLTLNVPIFFFIY